MSAGARKLAREAVRDAFGHKSGRVLEYHREIADAVSDVWEPIVRELHDMFGACHIQFDTPEETQRFVKAWIDARRALGIDT